MPRAASYSTIAPAIPPLDAPTMTASAVAINSPCPRPHPARKPIMPSSPWEAPASPLNTAVRSNPTTSVLLAPMRDETQPVTSIATAVTVR